MSKIKLLVKTDSNINELKRKEIQNIDWASFPFNEQIQYVDADVYSKLTKAGRYHIDRWIKDYTSKPVEYWNVVAAFNETYVAQQLWRTANLETKGIMISNHPNWFSNFTYSFKVESGTVSGGDLTSYILTYGDKFQYNQPDFWFLADPNIPVEEFNAPFKDYQSLLHFIYEVLEHEYEHHEYPVLVHNHMLKSAGYSPICDLSPKFLKSEDACSNGRIIAKKWIRTVTNGEKDYITWDEAVDYIRNNPSAYENGEIMEHLTWWWEHSFLGDY